MTDQTKHLQKLPVSLEEAIEVAQNSDFIKEFLDKKILNTFITEKTTEVEEIKKSKNVEEIENKMYFNNF